jgi:hypothetical protein
MLLLAAPSQGIAKKRQTFYGWATRKSDQRVGHLTLRAATLQRPAHHDDATWNRVGRRSLRQQSPEMVRRDALVEKLRLLKIRSKPAAPPLRD